MVNDEENANATEHLDYSKLATFFKYCSDNQCVINGIFKQRKIRFTQPAALNDPLEFNPIMRFKHNGSNYICYTFDGILFPNEEERLRLNLIESQLNKFGILSLTKVPNSFDMWSRYANGHKGFLLELKVDFNKHRCMLSRDGREHPVRQVIYVDEYAINVDELTDERGWIASETFNEELFFTKTSRWKGENEYRMVRPLADNPDWHPLGNKPHRDRNFYLFDFSLECVESITFGACMSVENMDTIMKACKGMDIKFQQACIIRDQNDQSRKQGKVVLSPIKNQSHLLKASELGFIGDSQHIDELRKPPIQIDNIDELPYYKSNKEWTYQYYEHKKDKRNLDFSSG